MYSNHLLIIITVLFGVIGMALIYGGQYLYKEKFIKSGMREVFYNTSVSDYPENKKGKHLLIAGQIFIGIDVLIILLYIVL